MRVKFRGNHQTSELEINFQFSGLADAPLRTLFPPILVLFVLEFPWEYILHRQTSMLPRTLPGPLPRRLFSISARMASTTPMEDLMRDKVGTLRHHIPFILYPLALQSPS